MYCCKGTFNWFQVCKLAQNQLKKKTGLAYELYSIPATSVTSREKRDSTREKRDSSCEKGTHLERNESHLARKGTHLERNDTRLERNETRKQVYYPQSNWNNWAHQLNNDVWYENVFLFGSLGSEQDLALTRKLLKTKGDMSGKGRSCWIACFPFVFALL